MIKTKLPDERGLVLVEDMSKMEGTVKFFNRKKGFGFVSGDDGNDYFVHASALPQGVFLRDGDKVSFTGGEGDRGLKAENIKLLQKASEMKPGEAGKEEDIEDTSDEDASDEENQDEE